ncbi:hypothetical protein MPSEU_001037900 [Mayamaea pseudoterrestris]|nr:hypothetical protein MPSEU_001037900 [Mayamaea pseudoterrestris]
MFLLRQQRINGKRIISLMSTTTAAAAAAAAAMKQMQHLHRSHDLQPTRTRLLAPILQFKSSFSSPYSINSPETLNLSAASAFACCMPDQPTIDCRVTARTLRPCH